MRIDKITVIYNPEAKVRSERFSCGQLIAETSSVTFLPKDDQTVNVLTREGYVTFRVVGTLMAPMEGNCHKYVVVVEE